MGPGSSVAHSTFMRKLFCGESYQLTNTMAAKIWGAKRPFCLPAFLTGGHLGTLPPAIRRHCRPISETPRTSSTNCHQTYGDGDRYRLAVCRKVRRLTGLQFDIFLIQFYSITIGKPPVDAATLASR